MAKGSMTTVNLVAGSMEGDMKLFLLEQLDSGGAYSDEYEAKIIRAENEDQARDIANMTTGDEGEIWEDDTMVSCVEVPQDGDPGVILDDFNGS